VWFQKDKTTKRSVQFLANLITPFVDCYCVAIASLKQLKQQGNSTLIEKSELLEKTQWFAETLYKEGFFEFQEACSLATIDQAVEKLRKMNLLTAEKDSKRKGNQTIFRIQ